MSSTTTNSTNPMVKLIGLVLLVAAVVMVAAGATTWAFVTSALKDENITVSAVTEEEPGSLAGKPVAGPFTAYAQANAIAHHALAGAEGRTYAELGEASNALKAELAADGKSEAEIAEDEGVLEIAAQRTTAMNGSFLRASLFTSVVSYGVAALVMGLGLLFGLLGFALRSISTTTVVTTATPTERPVASAV
ncbi:aromatic ring-opening dioxygenase LigA [Pengzhenrongella sicca]|uniref:Aromatic ring-opening dioxygenase LigA n=1 Tax=Pengzhenrongella sicca TaxID=2819238 RepID=A0A8A4ZDA4_9MICO|nr:aromatic ring-opening dioxygenase LigA [Pengzhenrongella sicca]QTE29932.1 aromatic ring-opening dioxygenase LigA [Pengzhenrongella sicca]